jgi:aldehyde oxidase
VFRSIDSSEVLDLPGVVDVITAEDIPGNNGEEDDKLLAVDKVWMGCALPVACADHPRTLSVT